jgi:hypothetical protein
VVQEVQQRGGEATGGGRGDWGENVK